LLAAVVGKDNEFPSNEISKPKTSRGIFVSLFISQHALLRDYYALRTLSSLIHNPHCCPPARHLHSGIVVFVFCVLKDKSSCVKLLLISFLVVSTLHTATQYSVCDIHFCFVSHTLSVPLCKREHTRTHSLSLCRHCV
jgi:hypothetical protein